MRSTVDLFIGPDLTLSEVTCRDDHTRWSAPEAPFSRHVLVLAQRGRFRRRGREGITDVDPHVGYLTEPGADECFAHPHGGDVCTAIGVGPALWAGLPSVPSHRSTVYVDARMELLHRRVIAAARAGDPDYALVNPHGAEVSESVQITRFRTAGSAGTSPTGHQDVNEPATLPGAQERCRANLLDMADSGTFSNT